MRRLLIWLSAILLLLIILFVSLGDGYRATNSTTITSFVVDDVLGNLNLIKGFDELAGFEDYVEAQLMVDFLKKNLDEASALAFMQELKNWLEIARCSSCFNVGEFFASSHFEKEEDHKMDLGNVSKEDLDTDTRNNINILYRGVHKTGKNCGASLLTGRRRTQQDRAVCLPDLLLPSLGGSGSISRTLGFFGVFDGHNGEEASNFVSKCLAQYFIHQVYTILGSLITHTFSFDSTVQPSLSKLAANITWQGSLSYAEGCKSCSAIQKSSSEAERQMSGICESRFYRTLYKKALSKAIFSIDLAFYEEARQKDWDAGTTACVVLIMDGHVLVSHLGDSKAYFCSSPCQNTSIKDVKLARREKRWPQNKLQRIIKATSKLADIETSLCKSSLVEELTQDHHPDRKQERGRIEAAGGFVEEWGGVARVNGVLAVSRSIGDLPFKR